MAYRGQWANSKFKQFGTIKRFMMPKFAIRRTPSNLIIHKFLFRYYFCYSFLMLRISSQSIFIIHLENTHLFIDFLI